ncbi:hypothetical protein ACFVU3_21495 [Streptomyces sp. NPDC058052]|uniref:hypothetical protein n=1 Tax=Streptomyces sp. NPDC058052 TaxID=3346316 RepID=UPI0036E078CA
MPRRRPGRVRATLPDQGRSPRPKPAIDRLSPRALSEIVRLERSRNYLRPGDVGAALRRWKAYVHRPERELWHDDEFGDAHWYCCGNPHEGRALLDAVLRAMSPRGARELRAIVEGLDAFMGSPATVPDRQTVEDISASRRLSRVARRTGASEPSQGA